MTILGKSFEYSHCPNKEIGASYDMLYVLQLIRVELGNEPRQSGSRVIILLLFICFLYSIIIVLYTSYKPLNLWIGTIPRKI